MSDFFYLKREIEKLKVNTSYFNIGKTKLNQNIICFVVGNSKSKNKILVQGGMHSREYITSFLLVEMIKYLKNFYLDFCVYFLPLINVDGVKICCDKLKDVKSFVGKEKLEKIIKNESYNQIKCNFNGVDLNTNFNALWGKGKQNTKIPNTKNFIGFISESENEVKSLINITKVLKPKITVSYHSKGEVFYYGFNKSKKYPKSYLKLEKLFKNIIKKETKYKPIFTKNSCGGYKDWCILELRIPSFTIEVGEDKLNHPIKRKYAKEIFEKNKNLVLSLGKIL